MSRLSLLKYFGENQGPDGQRLTWPGSADGFPFLGNHIPITRQAENEELPLTMYFRSGRFELSDPVQKKEFDRINDKILHGLYTKLERVSLGVCEKNFPIIWLEWGEFYSVDPKAGGNADGFFAPPMAGYAR